MHRRNSDIWTWALVGISTCLTLLVVIASDHAATEYTKARQVQNLERVWIAPVPTARIAPVPTEARGV